MTDQHAVIRRRYETHDLAHEPLTRMGRGPQHVNAA